MKTLALSALFRTTEERRRIAINMHSYNQYHTVPQTRFSLEESEFFDECRLILLSFSN